MTARAAIALLALLITGCASPIRRIHDQTERAAAVYSSGSGLTGNGRSLLLFADGRWERWGYSDIDATRNDRGTYTKQGNRLVLVGAGSGTETFQLRNRNGSEYLEAVSSGNILKFARSRTETDTAHE